MKKKLQNFGVMGSIVLLGLGFIVTFFYIYLQAMGLTWQFDDYINLKDLSNASSVQGLNNFIFGGVAGPTGRPISLLTFLANYNDWMNNHPWGFVKTTLIWHLLNACLIFLLVFNIAKIYINNTNQSYIFALMVAMVWVILPIHASANLIPIQRMTHVSAFFMLSTLLGYVYFRTYLSSKQSPILNLILVIGWVVIGTILAVYSKENGAVVVTMLALLELYFLKRITYPAYPKLWTLGIYLALLIVPLFMLLYLVKNWAGINHHFEFYRDRSLADHLATQIIILWEYLKQIILPRAALLGPFHDGHIVYHWTMWQPYVALIAWLVAIFVGWKYKAYRLGKFLLFALVWYFAAHQIESSIIPLELYFEHRNYLASLGWVVLIAVLFAEIYKKYQGLSPWHILGGIYILYLLFNLQQITSLWGKPLLAAEMWSTYQPDSPRAAQMLAAQYKQEGFREASIEVLNDFAQLHPKNISLEMQVFSETCEKNSSQQNINQLNSLKKNVAKISLPADITVNIASLGENIRQKKCAGVTLKNYLNFLMVAAQVPKIKQNANVMHHVNYETALTYQEMDNTEAYLTYATRAFYNYPSLSIAEKIALTYFKQANNEKTLAWIKEALQYAPSNANGDAWRKSLKSLAETIKSIESQRSKVDNTPHEK
ncbi:hypothetical protein [Acinetobacter sp. WCHA45]|uniref:hypothetical protein n=1 Tax=Acinetobacter sp. WCHA45 TaxID=2004644 RepID=UPI000B3D01D0|nr:hypothetical protein [Acinetobacter sp. WCHA45]AVZ84736.1 hypothetical protein CDG55_02540 [Acinetobacter sp. WCHA45]